MIRYPPTPTTWVCLRKVKRSNQYEAEYETTCNSVIPGRYERCHFCGKRKGKHRLLWPDYLKACEKAGVEPRRTDG